MSRRNRLRILQSISTRNMQRLRSLIRWARSGRLGLRLLFCLYFESGHISSLCLHLCDREALIRCECRSHLQEDGCRKMPHGVARHLLVDFGPSDSFFYRMRSSDDCRLRLTMVSCLDYTSMSDILRAQQVKGAASGAPTKTYHTARILCRGVFKWNRSH